MVRGIIKKIKLQSLLLMATLLTSLSGCSGQITQANTDKLFTRDGSYLDRVKARGYTVCGVSGEVPGFSFVDFNGKYAGIDVDFCRAVASALFDDPEKVEFRELDLDQRFAALESGEIDILSRNTTQTLRRDTKTNIEFTPVLYYDSQGIMVRRDSQIKTTKDLEGKSICVEEGTTSYQNLPDFMTEQQIDYKAVVKSEKEALYDAYEHNNCQGIVGDTSQLMTRKILLANPSHHVILPQKIAREPLAPAVLHQDSEWFDAVKWITFALIQAEELNINSENLSIHKNSQDLEIRKFLGKNSTLGSQMKLSDDFTFRIIKHVGNYGEIYDRNIGEPFNLERGQNALWNDGGLMYSPPFN